MQSNVVRLVIETPDFETFWRSYPRRVAKQAALKAWSKLTPVDRTAAIQAIPQHVKQWSDPQFIPHASTWLNGRRFEDELEVDLRVTPCKWKGCERPGTNTNGSASYCERHIMAVKRGETP